jgi:hypothetical protein
MATPSRLQAAFVLVAILVVTEAAEVGPWTVLSGDSIAALPLAALDYRVVSHEVLPNGITMENGTFATGPFSTLNSKGLPQVKLVASLARFIMYLVPLRSFDSQTESLRASTVLFSPVGWNSSKGPAVGLVAGSDNDAHLISELAADLQAPILLAGYGNDIPRLFGYHVSRIQVQ